MCDSSNYLNGGTYSASASRYVYDYQITNDYVNGSLNVLAAYNLQYLDSYSEYIEMAPFNYIANPGSFPCNPPTFTDIVFS